MQIVRKQDHEGWQKIAVNLGNKYIYLIYKIIFFYNLINYH